ncbi:golgin subfamily A member 1 isoform X1 [Plodia interpunctella]|uniref:golgin subfamily A member 1 isoform X1 n=1 Tax=Plodia interpunctella TaxID=58824 RepID=UPI00236836D5|nr:golgin subfamily A member 1 isoform X1 [Plodia interpunctella]XP_053607942.1 golgin subfamily A member 1 isoform X1 [Plodia interpunctella]
MFASLKSKIKEETGSDISKLTSSWRNGAFLGRISLRDDSSTASPSSSGGPGDSTSDSISPQLESYLSDRTGGQVDQAGLQQQYAAQLELKLKDRDAYWEKKIEELKLSLASVQGEEAAAAQSVARTAQAEAARAASERDAALSQLRELRARLAAVERAQDRLDDITEELEQSRREWSRERSQLSAALSAADARARDLADQLAVVSAALPTDHALHHMHDDDKRELSPSGCEDYDVVCRERAVLSRQLQEAKVALADVKTSWSGQIASLETQVARLSRQAGEEGAERRRVEMEKKEMQDKLVSMAAELEKARQNLANSEAKVVRLNGEAHSLALEVKALRNSQDHSDDKTMDLETRIQELTEENDQLKVTLENERTLVKILKEKVDKSNRLYDEQKAEVSRLSDLMTEVRNDRNELRKKHDKERREKDEAILRNAHMSQSIEMSQSNVRYQETEIADLKAKMTELEAVIAQHKENQAACMLIKETEEARKTEIEELKRKVEESVENEAKLKKTIQQFETEICDKNKKIKSLDCRIADMKKTLQRELQNSKSDLSAAEEQDISRRYLKHVVLRFLTARELEARQLTRALSTLLRLSPHEEALLRAALAARSAWFPSLS